MKKNWYLAILAIVLAGVIFSGDIKTLWDKGTARITENFHAEELLADLKTEIFTPPPLRQEFGPQDSYLTAAGVVKFTNQHRNGDGLPGLAVNAKLSEAAKAKVDDMFARQYFEHVSPVGVGADQLVKSAGYSFILVGENLALGNYEDDALLVQAWMDSPGHRENILNERFTEIGVAVKRGTFEGKSTWLAVQEFGKPLSDCPTVNESLRVAIENGQVSLDSLQVQIEQKQTELDAAKTNKREDRQTYNQKVAEFNALVNTYNAKLEVLKKQIAEYNSEVQEFNVCIAV
ncbi:MAG: hypothetical protein HY397_00130 [Candidatus Doudnabacteria bacterium]|nr:hypothetical protein [Candidatus Doudnabacteria bacterium]